ncbi:hypothetical protein [Paenibacillus taiwanensis]|uniref:hypothetical protein n=1 Tax=Paenibacillus taiwanensis TaxID=401638 RepID=UPI001FE2024D|nr:hypothetical protein [Paenibacillus taiwanensis]
MYTSATTNKVRSPKSFEGYPIVAMAQVIVEVWQEDSAGVYCFCDAGIVEKYSSRSVKIRNESGESMYYDRELTMFKTRKAPTDG